MAKVKTAGKGLNKVKAKYHAGRVAEQTAEVLWLVPVEQIDRASYNPKNTKPHLERDNCRARGVRKLRDSIARHGLIHPIIVVAAPQHRYKLIDGHRRLAATILNGGTEILARVLELGTHEAEAVYAECNAYSQPHSPADRLKVYIENPEAILPEEREKLDVMVSIIGESLCEQMARGGFTYATFRQAKRIADACLGDQTPVEHLCEFVRTALAWLMETHGTKEARDRMEAGDIGLHSQTSIFYQIWHYGEKKRKEAEAGSRK